MPKQDKLKNIPPAKDLMAAVTSKQINVAASFLLSRATVLQNYPSLDDLAYDFAADPMPSELRGLNHNMAVVRNAILAELRRNAVFIGPSIVEELVFEVFKNCEPGGSPLLDFFKLIRNARLHEPGLVIYPLHSVGILGLGFAKSFARNLSKSDLNVEFTVPEAGLVFSPQTNSEAGTVELVKRVQEYLGLRRTVPEDSLQHHMRIHATAWLTRNPLLFVKTRVYSGAAYENQRFLLLKVQISTALLLFLAALERGIRGRKAPSWTGSRSANNWQTLDIHHYLVYQASGRPGRRYAGQRIPMNVDTTDLSEVSGVGIDFNPYAWKKRPAITSRLVSALSDVERGYLQHVMVDPDDGIAGRVFRKLFSSLGYFRRSFRPLSRYEDRCVNIAVAFETLLTDSYGAPRETITRRAEIALKGVPNADLLRRSARNIYVARNSIVHTGAVKTRADLKNAQRAFTHCFLAIVERLDRLPKASDAPIGALLGDTFKPKKEKCPSCGR